MRRWLALCMLMSLLLPGFVSAQERWLRGKVVRIGEHGEKIIEVNVTVALEGQGDPRSTNSQGEFRIFLKDIFKAGEKVTLVIDKPGWRIRYPLEEEARIPADLDKELIEVEFPPVGSKLFWTHDRIEELISNMAEKSKQQVTPEGRPETIDFSRYIKDWSVKHGFSAQQAKEEIDKWIADIETNQNDRYKLGLAEFAKKNFAEASKLFNEAAEYQTKELAEIRRKKKEAEREEKAAVEDLVRTIRLEGHAHYNNYIFDKALNAYHRALVYVSRQQTPQSWAATHIDIGRANWGLGIRAEGLDIGQYLSSAVKAYYQALEVRTRETLLAQWVQAQNNLAQAYMHLEDWANAAASYAAVLTVYPDNKTAYNRAGYLYHEALFEFPMAFLLNQRWLEQNPADLSALSDFAEKHFTTGRFTEREQRIALLLTNPTVAPRVQIALQAIQIANSLALSNSALVPGRIDAMVEGPANQSEGFKVGRSFKGTRHFISNNDTLTAYRAWLMRLFDAVEEADRHAILSALQEVRASFLVEVKR
jgi:tetratricopeptide (TPR) repeat protein